ncbi:MAG: methane monooxygenase [Candidatus Binataceae bacterium]|nr:methane monooxygenase [Candidatus Binataceae bacterium]
MDSTRGLDEAGGRGPTDWLGGWKTLFVGCAALLAANLFLWLFDYKYAFTIGLNSATHAFTTHYRALFWAELLTNGIFCGLWYGWLIRTGRALENPQAAPREEVRRIAVLWGIIGATSLSLYIEASFWPNWDGAWHQTMVRDTALTPTHIPMFYFFFPLSVVLALGAYIYGRYRIPALYSPDKGFPWSFFLLISAAVLEFMQVAFNEWGHSLWLSEEFFSVPFHWPFVAYGWLASGMFAVWGESILRLYQIEKSAQASEEAPIHSAAAG